MPYDLVDATGARCRLPASVQPTQQHVGGGPRARFLRGYGSDDWTIVQDGHREPAVLNLTGVLHTDRDETLIQELLDELQAAAYSAVAIAHVASDNLDVEHLELLGALPITTEPDGIDGTLLRVTVPLLPGGGAWAPGSPPGAAYLLLDSGGVMLLDNGASAVQQ